MSFQHMTVKGKVQFNSSQYCEIQLEKLAVYGQALFYTKVKFAVITQITQIHLHFSLKSTLVIFNK